MGCGATRHHHFSMVSGRYQQRHLLPESEEIPRQVGASLVFMENIQKMTWANSEHLVNPFVGSYLGVIARK
jgi:hypothetical protein